MEFSLVADTVAVCTVKQGIAFGKSLINRWDLANNISFDDSAVDHQFTGGIVQPSAVIFPVDDIAPYKTTRRIRKKQRTKRLSFDNDSKDGWDFGIGRFLLQGYFVGHDGPFGFGGGGGGRNDGGGKGWNSGGGGGSFGRGNWDESSFSSWSDPAMEFVYEVICWIALSNCVHFAFKRIVRIVTDGDRE